VVNASVPPMLVSEAVGRTVHALGGDVVFGLMGSGNLAVTNAIVAAGGRFFSSRHETGAVCMADGYARLSERLGVVSVHQGPGLTNAITGLTEAAKSRTPLLLLAADTPAVQLRSNFKIDQDALVESVGAISERVHSAQSAVADTARAVRRALNERRAVVLNLPLDVQSAEIELTPPPPQPRTSPPVPMSVSEAAGVLRRAERPVIIGGRGAVRSSAGPALRELAERTGALLATSAVGNGLFEGDPFNLGISGGFSTPIAQRLIAEADVVIAFGAALNLWTTRHGALIADDATVIQVDDTPEAIGAHRRVDIGLVGDAEATARALLATLDEMVPAGVALPSAGRRTEALAAEIAAGRWRDQPYEESRDWLDPRSLTIALDDVLPEERCVVVDSGAFMGYPAMYLRVPNPGGFVFPQAFQCVGLALGNAIGAAVFNPDRVTVCAVGDGGLLMALPDLETLGRLKLRVLVVVYNDAAYGAEVHHFRPMGIPVELAQFPPTDFAALAEAAGCRGVTVRTVDDLSIVREWAEGPLVLDCKVDPDICAEWLEEAFRGH